MTAKVSVAARVRMLIDSISVVGDLRTLTPTLSPLRVEREEETTPVR